jgi:hypothetical protein
MPALPHPPSGPGGIERRRTPRFDALGQILATLLSIDRPVWVRDIGLGGFSVESVEPLETGVEHWVRFTARDDSSAVLKAQSLHSRPSVAADGSPRFVTGFAFLPVPAEETTPAVTMLIEKVTSVGLYDDPAPL